MAACLKRFTRLFPAALLGLSLNLKTSVDRWVAIEKAHGL
jgi:hypothetical protein